MLWVWRAHWTRHSSGGRAQDGGAQGCSDRTSAGPAIAAITTGGFVVELVFAIPGLGRYFVEAVQQLDYTVIMGTTVFYGAFLVFMVIIVDVVYGLIDPRVRLET